MSISNRKIFLLPALFAVVLVGLSLLISITPKVTTVDDVYRENVGKIVRVLAKEKANSKTTYGGTGFFIDDRGTIVTAAHAVYFDDTQKVAGAVRIIIGDDKTLYRAKVLKVDLKHDVALLRVSQASDFYKEMGYAHDSKATGSIDRKFGHVEVDYDYAPRAGDIIFIMGFPMDFEDVISTGIVMSNKLVEIDTDDGSAYRGMILGGAFVTHGNSGGPVFGPDGRVIGMVTAGNDAGLALIQPVSHIKRLLEDKSDRVVIGGGGDLFLDILIGVLENA